MNLIIAIVASLIALVAVAGVVRYTVLRTTPEPVPRRLRVAAGLGAVLLLGLVTVQTVRPFQHIPVPMTTILQPKNPGHSAGRMNSTYDGALLLSVLLVRTAGDSLFGYGDVQSSDLVAITQVHGAAADLLHVPVEVEARLGWRDSIHVTVQPDVFAHAWQDDPTSSQARYAKAHPDSWFVDVPSVVTAAHVTVQRTSLLETWSIPHELCGQSAGSLWRVGTGWEPRRPLQLGGCRVSYGLILMTQPLTDVTAVAEVPILPALERMASSGLGVEPLPEVFGDSAHLEHSALALAVWSGLTGFVLIGIAMLGACVVPRWNLAVGFSVLLVVLFASLLDRVAVGLELGRIGRLATPAEMAHLDVHALLRSPRIVNDYAWDASFFHQQAAYASWMARTP